MVFISGWSSIPIGQFSIPLQWQLWTLCLDNVNYSIFFWINFEAQNFSTNNHKNGPFWSIKAHLGMNSEPQYFQPPAPRKKHLFEHPKTTTNQLWKSPQTWQILNQLTGQTLKGQNPTLTNQRCFFQGQKPSRFHPFFGTWNVSNIDAWHVWSAAVQ